ncbi:MAG TPA: zinc-ribbon domain-containing protein [Paraburkholderia sp.]|nr:zinc-ribbon domain-containing protein [Paraburkholderia sp.]
MLLATRCPFCETVFRLQPAHLALRRGLVRCGHCHEVFDATSSLFETDSSGDLTRATPVTPEVVAALVAGQQPVSEAATSGAGESHAEGSGAKVEAQTSVDTEAVAAAEDVETAEAVEPAKAVEAAETAHQAAEKHAADTHPQSNTGSETEPHPTHEAAHPPLPGRPNFRSDSWNPWAPAPDAVIDDRLRHSTKNLPYRPLPEAAMAKLRQAIEREAAHRAAQNGSGPAPEQHVDTPAVEEQPAHEAADVQTNAFTQTHDEGNAPAITNGSGAHASAQVDKSASHSAEAGGTLNAVADVDDAASIEPAHHDRVNGSASFHPAIEREHHETTDESAQVSSWRAVEAAPDKDIEPAFGSAAGTSSATTFDNEPHFSKPSPEPFAAAQASEGDEPFAVVRETRPAEPRRLGWRILGTLVALALVVVLVAQLAWWQRETVMVYWPRSQMLFAQACAQLG